VEKPAQGISQAGAQTVELAGVRETFSAGREVERQDETLEAHHADYGVPEEQAYPFVLLADQVCGVDAHANDWVQKFKHKKQIQENRCVGMRHCMTGPSDQI
jgi:hypothetical protein